MTSKWLNTEYYFKYGEMHMEEALRSADNTTEADYLKRKHIWFHFVPSAQLNMFRGTSLQPAEWILFYPYADYKTKEETVKIIQLLFYNSRWKTQANTWVSLFLL